jgi:uncharacterized protein (DUF362 family)
MTYQCTRRDLIRSAAAAAAFGALRPVGLLAGTDQAGADAPSLPVAIQRCRSYQPQEIVPCLEAALDGIGGIKTLVEGKTVTIKLNLTGGPRWKLGGLPAAQTYHVHPGFVAATCAILHKAGAKQIVLVESGYAREPLEEVMAAAGWDIPQINQAGGGKVHWEDTRHQGAWKGYSRLQVPWGGYIYPAYDLNMRYEKTDVLVSIGKLKDHANAGVTLSIKNQFGIAPTSIYGDHYSDATGRAEVVETSISARGDTFHKGVRQPPAGVPQEVDPNSSRDWSYRVPRITADLFGVRPPDLCLVDGIETNRGGEGPWIQGVQPLKPHLLFAGRNGVCTDAVCAAAMGYDPTVGHKQFPFMGDNHLKLLAEQGLGTHHVDQIEICGLPLKDATFPFNPKKLTVGRPIFS